ncbi:MAG: preprotein translocase subunit SecE [Candidatus Delongbacteria bacterium]|nr:preprotein translocase subunit SecE [Candidatus Delongbacteria bacterium]
MGKMVGYFKSLVTEMKLISWPKKPEVWGSSKIVIAMSLILVLFVFLSDQVLNWLIGMFL